MAERPTSQGLFLGEQLQRYRDARGLSLYEVAAHLGCSKSKVSRIENGRSKIRVADIVKLLDLYGVADEAQRAYLVDFTHQQETRPTGWWRERTGHQAGNVPQYLALEAVADTLRNIEPTLIPGLLQTPGYSRVVMRTRQEGEALDRATAIRLARRDRMIRGDLKASFLIGETALTVVPDEVRHDQVRLLLSLAQSVSIRVIPQSEIAPLTHGNPLVLLGFTDMDIPSVAYVEHWAGSFVIDDLVDVMACELRFETIEKVCLTQYDTIDWLTRLLES